MRSRDPKFDGRFFIGVFSTGIYCRPICPAPTPLEKNIDFFPSAAAAASAGLRPCLRCRPETMFETNARHTASPTVNQALAIMSNRFPWDVTISDLAEKLGISRDSLKQGFQEHLGVLPSAIWQTQRLHFAKRLIDDSNLKMADIALAAGYGSARSLTEAFNKTYRHTPAALREKSRTVPERKAKTVHLLFNPPFDWEGLLGFMSLRAIPGVESVSSGCYQRCIVVNGVAGSLKIWLDSKGRKKNRLTLEIDFPDLRQLFKITRKVTGMFDLDAPTLEIDEFLGQDPLLSASLEKNRGIRIPGCWDPFELSIRAILGQQVSVKGASTIAGRIAKSFGKKVLDPEDSTVPDSIFPGPEILKEADYTGIGLIGTRIQTIRDFSAAVIDRQIDFDDPPATDKFRDALKKIKGIGEWTAQYIAMRVLKDPDAFPESDLGLLKAAATSREKLKPKELLQLSRNWQPWRAYAASYLWRK